MCVQRETGVRWPPRTCTGHLVTGVDIFLKLGTVEEEFDEQCASVLLAFLSACKSPRRSASWDRLHSYIMNFFFSLSLYIPPPSLYALVINWVSSSLCQYCLTFCFLFSFYLVSLARPLSSFIPYPSFPLFTLLLSLSPSAGVFTAGPGDIQCPRAVSWRQLHLRGPVRDGWAGGGQSDPVLLPSGQGGAPDNHREW